MLLLQEGKKKAKFDKEYCLRFAALYFGPLKNDMAAYAERDVNGAKAAGGAGLPKFVQKTSAPASDSSLYQVCPLRPRTRMLLKCAPPNAPRDNPCAWVDGALYSREELAPPSRHHTCLVFVNLPVNLPMAPGSRCCVPPTPVSSAS